MAWFCTGFIMYIVPLLIGRTYDIKNHVSGIDIFSKTDVENSKLKVIESPKTSCIYTTVSSEFEKNKLLDIPIELSLQFQAGILKAPGLGQYIEETFDPLSAIHVVIKCTVTRATKELDADAVPIDNWLHFNNKILGTHFVNKINYGGELFAAIIFKAYKLVDRSAVEAKVKAIMETVKTPYAFETRFESKMRNLINELAHVANVEYKFYSTVPFDSLPTDVKDLTNLIKKFPEQIKEKSGIGSPVCVHLQPLSKFDFIAFPDLQINDSTIREMGMNFESWFQYARVAKLELKNLLLKLSWNIGEESETKLGKFRDRLKQVLISFHNAIGNLDIEESPEQFKPAKDLYIKNSKIAGFLNRYTEELKELKAEMKVHDDRRNPRIVYTHWGKERCHDPKVIRTLYRGYIAGLKPGVNGGGTQYLCLPDDPHWTNEDYTGQLYGTEASLVGITYGSENATNERMHKLTGRLAMCAVCEVVMARSVETFVARKECPKEWTKEYVGQIVSYDGDRQRKENICLDAYPDEANQFHNWSASNAAIVPVVSSGKTVPCVVCSKHWIPT